MKWVSYLGLIPKDETFVVKFGGILIDKFSLYSDYIWVIRKIVGFKQFLKWKTTIAKQLKISKGKDSKMSVKVKQPIPSRTIKAYVRDEAESRWINLSDQIDVGAVYAVVSSMIIWICFILAFWWLI